MAQRQQAKHDFNLNLNHHRPLPDHKPRLPFHSIYADVLCPNKYADVIQPYITLIDCVRVRVRVRVFKAGAVDGYLLARGRLAITVATSRFGKPNIHTSEVMSIAAVVATHLDILRDQCNKAKEKLEATVRILHA